MFCIWMILLLRYSIVFFIQLSRTHIKAGCVRGAKADDKFSSGSRVFHWSSHICRSTSDRSLTDPSVRLPAHSGKCASNQTFAAACRRLQQRVYGWLEIFKFVLWCLVDRNCISTGSCCFHNIILKYRMNTCYTIIITFGNLIIATADSYY